MLASSLLLILAVSAQSQRTDFEWFDTLGKTDTLKHPFVQTSGGAGNSKWSTVGFLIRGDGKNFSILQPNLITSESPDQSSYESTYRPADLQAFAKRALKFAKMPPQERSYDESAQGDPPIFDDPLSLFVLSRACELRGLHDLSTSLYKEFTEGPHFASTSNFAKLSPSEGLKDDVADSLYAQIRGDIGDLRVSRADLLEQYRFIISHFPATEYEKSASKMAAILEPMVAEDSQHLPLSYQETQRLPVEQRIAELIFQLRDQNGHQWMEPGYCDVFADPRNEKSPADQLVKIGIAAVPSLIKRFDDLRPTRSVSSGFRYTSTVEPLTIEDVSLATLEKIACRQFSLGPTSNADQKRKILTWWSGVQRLGEEAYLVRAVSLGDPDSAMQARRLVEAYPASAFEALREGIASTKDPSQCSWLIDELGRLDDARALKVGHDQMLHGKGLAPRLAGARIVAKSNEAEAATVMAKVWNSLHSDGLDDLISFLASTSQPVAVRALHKGIRDRSIDVRIDIVRSFLNGFPELSGDDRTRNEYRRAVEDLLVSQLTDEATRDGMSMSNGDRSFTNPMVGEVALSALADCFPKKYFYKKVGSPREQLRMRLVALNTWRQQRGLKPLALRQKPVVGKVDPVRAKTYTSAKIFGRHQSPAVLKKMRSLVGSKVSGQRTIRLANDILKVWPKSANKIVLLLIREDDNAGFKISAQLLGSDQASKGLNDVDFSIDIHAGTEQVGGSGMGGAGDIDETELYFTRPIDKALNYPPLTPIVVRITLSKK